MNKLLIVGIFAFIFSIQLIYAAADSFNASLSNKPLTDVLVDSTLRLTAGGWNTNYSAVGTTPRTEGFGYLVTGGNNYYYGKNSFTGTTTMTFHIKIKINDTDGCMFGAAQNYRCSFLWPRSDGKLVSLVLLENGTQIVDGSSASTIVNTDMSREVVDLVIVDDGTYISVFKDCIGVPMLNVTGIGAGSGTSLYLGSASSPTNGWTANWSINYFSYDTGNLIYPSSTSQNCSVFNPLATTPINLTIAAKDNYDNSAILSYSANLSGFGNDQIFQTTNGTILISNITNGLYNMTILSTQYFSAKYYNVNVSGQSFQANLSQSYLSVYANDTVASVLLYSFTAANNLTSYSTSSGYISMPLKAGTYSINVTSSQYPPYVGITTIAALQNVTYIANLSPIFQFYLRREADNSIFDINSTNSTKVTVICPNKNIVIIFRNSTYGSTQENKTIDCVYSYLKLDVVYPDTSYFRTLIPATTQQNVTWWLLDLNKDTGVQKILNLVDLTGSWSSGRLRLTANIGQTNERIIEQYFDVSTGVTLYLLKDSIYTVTIINSAGNEERQIGTLTADTAGTVTIIYPNIPFYPENTQLEKNMSWSYTCPFSQCIYPRNTSDSILRFQYADSLNGTNTISWKIYNGSNTSVLLQQFTSSAHNLTFTYQPVFKNITYFATLSIQNTLLSFNISENKIFGDFELPVLEGFTKGEQSQWAFYLSGIFVIVWGLSFSAYHVGIGLATTFIWLLIFRIKGWLPLHPIWLALIGVAAIMTFVVEGMKKD